MFCYQCEEAAKGIACTRAGVCGKKPEVAALQDLLIHAIKGISMYAHRAAQAGIRDREIDVFVIKALFTTVTNVNFSPDRLQQMLLQADAMKEQAKKLYLEACQRAGCEPEELGGPAAWKPVGDLQSLVQQGEEVGLEKLIEKRGADAAGLEQLLTSGLKGMAAYADHAQILGQQDEAVYAFFHEALDFLTREDTLADELLNMNMRCGEINLQVMELLDRANTGTYGHPEPTAVRVTPVKGKAILISGHDLKDLEALLQQTQGTGINVYTHCEMLPANAYPELKKYSHLVGNYGGAWHTQQKEFEQFPGPIVMTTNCIQKPKASYQDRMFTTGLVAWPGVTHISNRDFTPVIEAARQCDGFKKDAPEQTITVGFGHNATLGVADKVIKAVKNGQLRHFFLVGGCDGHKNDRDYYSRFAREVPNDCVIMTLACGKFRFNKQNFGDIGGIPRLLDVGQCNDAYSAIKVASALAEAFDCEVNDLPLSLVLSWYEQKAVCILLSLLYLGIRDIRLGPSLPAFLTPDVLGVLVDKFNIKPIGSPEADIEACLGEADADAA